jgi:hypothetical protein
VHVLHQTKQVKTRITDGLCKASAGAPRWLETDGVAHNAVVCELALFGSEPASSEWVVWEQEESDDGDTESHCAFDDEEPGCVHQQQLKQPGSGLDLPFPTRQPVLCVKGCERSLCNESRECGSKDIARVQDTDARRNLLTSVEEREQVQSAWIVWRLRNSEEEAHDNETCVVVGQSSACGNDGPCHHTDAHVDRGANFLGRHQHV